MGERHSGMALATVFVVCLYSFAGLFVGAGFAFLPLILGSLLVGGGGLLALLDPVIGGALLPVGGVVTGAAFATYAYLLTDDDSLTESGLRENIDVLGALAASVGAIPIVAGLYFLAVGIRRRR